MRRNSELSGSPLANPQASPISTFAVRGGFNNQAPTQPHYVDFSGLSRVIQQAVTERHQFEEGARQVLGGQVSELREQGIADEEIVRRLTESGNTPRRTAAWLARQVQSGTLDEIDNPAFRLGLEARRAESRVREYGRSLAGAVDAAAQVVSQAEPGTEQDAAVEQLRALREEHGEGLSSLGFFGSRAAEPALAEENQRFLDAVSARQREIRREEYRSHAVAGIRELAAGYSTAKTSEERAEFINKISREYDRAKLEGIRNPDEFFENAIRAAGAQIGINAGYGEAKSFLEDALYGATSGSGAVILQGSESLAIISDISRYEALAEDEKSQEGVKLAQAISGEANRLRVSDVGKSLSDAARKGANQVVTVAAYIKEDIEANPEGYGLTKGDQEALDVALAAIDDLEEDYLRSSASRAGLLVESNKYQIEQISIQEGLDVALERIGSLDLNANSRAQLEIVARNIAGNENNRVSQTLNQTGVRKDIYDIVRVALYPDLDEESLSFSQGAEVGQVADRLFSDLLNRTLESNKNPEFSAKFTQDQAYKTAQDYVKNIQEKLAGQQPVGSPEADKVISQTRSRITTANKSDRVQAFLTKSDPVLLDGSERDENSVESLVYATQKLKSGPIRGWESGTDFNEISRALYSLSYGDTDLPEFRKDIALSQALLSSGHLGAVQATRLFRDGEKWLQSQAESGKGLSGWLAGVQGLDTSSLNVFTSRIRDYSNAQELIYKDPVTGAARMRQLTASDAQKLTELLESAGIPPTLDNGILFLASQAAMWGKPLK